MAVACRGIETVLFACSCACLSGVPANVQQSKEEAPSVRQVARSMCLMPMHFPIPGINSVCDFPAWNKSVSRPGVLL